jgi:hypothetical protein
VRDWNLMLLKDLQNAKVGETTREAPTESQANACTGRRVRGAFLPRPGNVGAPA